MAESLSTNLASPSSVPYFLWDEPMTVEELRRRMSESDGERLRLLGKILREARDTDVWQFTTPSEVLEKWNDLSKYLGRRREFWRQLLDFWEKEGLID